MFRIIQEEAVVQCVSFEDKVSKQADKENVSHGPINSIYAFSDGDEIFVATGCVKGIIRMSKFVTDNISSIGDRCHYKWGPMEEIGERK